MDSLFVIQGNEQGTRRVLDRDVVTLGRDSSNIVQLRDVEASRRHAEIRRVDDWRCIVDLGSSNGVFVNGRRVKSRRLENGDQIQIGKTILLFASRKIEIGAKEPLVDVFQDSDAVEASRVVHSLSPRETDDLFENDPAFQDAEVGGGSNGVFNSNSNAAKQCGANGYGSPSGGIFNDAAQNAGADWLQKARAHLNFMYRATLAASQTLDVERLLHRFLELIFQWAPVDRGCIFLYDADADKLVPKSSKCRKKNGRVEVSQTILNYAFRNQKCVLTSNASADSRWDGSASVLQSGVKEAICVPMQGRYGLVGVVYVDVSRSLSDVELDRAVERAERSRRSESENAAPPSNATPYPASVPFANPTTLSAENRNASPVFSASELLSTDDDKPNREKRADAEPFVSLHADDGHPAWADRWDFTDPESSENFDLALTKRESRRREASTPENSLAEAAVAEVFPNRDAAAFDLNDRPAPIWPRRSKKLTFDHLKLMVALGRQAALAIEDTQFYLGMAQAERLAAIGQTVAVLSHHIKNILQGIRGGSYLIQTGLKEEDVDLINKGWNIVDKNQSKISDLVLDMLTFSKERTPVWSFADFGETTADAVELMKGRADDLEVDLLFRPDETVPKFYFDKEQIHRAIVNLIGNAIEASKDYDPDALDDSDSDAPNAENASPAPDVSDGTYAPQPSKTERLSNAPRRPKFPRGRVETTVQYDAAGSCVRVVVDDVGPGVPPEMRDVLFRPFASKNKSGGTGLGLAVTHKIVSEHKGELAVETSPLGGARFVVELPLVLEKPSELDDAEPFESRRDPNRDR